MYLPLSNITIEEIKADFLEEKNINLSMLRLDKLHETVSGNKLFKLHYYIELMEIDNWRTYKPIHLYRLINEQIEKRLG